MIGLGNYDACLDTTRHHLAVYPAFVLPDPTADLAPPLWGVVLPGALPVLPFMPRRQASSRE